MRGHSENGVLIKRERNISKRGFLKKALTMLVAFALIIGLCPNAAFAGAKAKAPKLAKKKISLNVGASKKIAVKNKPAKAKITYTSKNKKIAKVNKKGKVTGVKKGSTKIIVKISYKNKGKKVNKKLTAKVTVKEAATVTPTTGAAVKPATTPAVAKTAAPATQAAASSAPAAPTAEATVEPVATPDLSINGSNLTTEHESKNGVKTKDNGMMRTELSTLELIDGAMDIGWNLGNQMEQSNYKGTLETVYDCETSAGNPAATQKTFDGLRSFGVNVVRIPVAWSNFMSTDGKYTISEDLLKRVEQIINYALSNEMYVIINDHWDGGWWGMFGSPDEKVREEAWKKYESMWTQIAERYSEYSDRLIFEAANEELSGAFPGTGNLGLNTRVGADGFFDVNGAVGTLTEDEIYQTAYEISQKFVDIVRESGGNNKYRHLLIPGNTTSLDKALDERFKMPVDIEENGNTKLSLDFHCYDPQAYGLSATASTGDYADKWGTDEEKQWLRNFLERVSFFTDQGYGVIAGECGIVKAYKDNIIDYLRYYFELCEEFHIAPVLWDEGHYFDRKNGYFQYSDVGDLIAEVTGSTPEIPANAKTKTTGIPVIPTPENPSPKVCYTWTGEFMRHTNEEYGRILEVERPGEVIVTDKGEAGIATTSSISEGMKAEFNEEWWNMHVTCDWSTIEEPCIRVYPADNETSQGLDLQLAYMNVTYDENGKAKEGLVKMDVDYIQETGQFWKDKYILLDEEMLAEEPWIWITTNTYTGASIVKVELCDAAYNADGSKYESADAPEPENK